MGSVFPDEVLSHVKDNLPTLAKTLCQGLLGKFLLTVPEQINTNQRSESFFSLFVYAQCLHDTIVHKALVPF